MYLCKLDTCIRLDNDPIQFTFWSRNRVIDRLRLLPNGHRQICSEF